MSARIGSAGARRQRSARSTGLAARPGMTLIEIMIAMLIMTGVLLALGSFTAKFAQAASQAHFIMNANEIAVARLDAVRQQPTYTAIDTLASTDTMRADKLLYTVKTSFVRIGGGATDLVDYKIVTVNVSYKEMRKVVTKSTAITAF
jgi:prepilin-type N-terminal cleavage/methylation domain-containing protein